MKTSKTNKKAISLIVLVITIIVMIILAGTIILTLNNSGIIDKAREALKEYDLDEVQTLASMLWSEAYVDEIREQKDLEIYVKKGLANYNIDLDVYVVTVTESGVDVVIIPEAWRGKVVNIVDGVPIPKGFVASQATGENTKMVAL